MLYNRSKKSQNRSTIYIFKTTMFRCCRKYTQPNTLTRIELKLTLTLHQNSDGTTIYSFKNSTSEHEARCSNLHNYTNKINNSNCSLFPNDRNLVVSFDHWSKILRRPRGHRVTEAEMREKNYLRLHRQTRRPKCMCSWHF